MMDDGMDTVAEQVFTAVGDLGARFGREWSVKIDTQQVSTNRFLLGLRKPRISGDPDARLFDTCASLGMPPAALAQYRSELPSAQYVHFGFELSAGIPWIKAYLEFFDEVDARLRSGEPRQLRYLAHRGFKWVPNSDGAANVTSYWWYPYLSSAEVQYKLEEVLANDESGQILSVASGLLATVIQRTRPHNLHFLEVVEGGNERRSFDINFYRAQLRMADVKPSIEAAFAIHGQAFGTFADRVAGITGERFGHLAGGIDRRGRSFMTFYYGMSYFEPIADRAP